MKQAQGYVHIRETEKGGATAGWYRDTEANQIAIFFAHCSHNDLYNKKIGRGLVEQRLAEYLVQPVEVRMALKDDVVTNFIKIDEVKQHLEKFFTNVFDADTVNKMKELVTVASIHNKEILNVTQQVYDSRGY